MKTWFTSDWHLGHDNIIKYCNRPFKSHHDMDAHFIQQANKYVDKNDIMYFLGDVLFAPKDRYVQKLRAHLGQINCKNIIFLIGNHDPPMLEKFFHNLGLLANITAEGQKIVLSHYPLASYQFQSKGGWHLYGHCHTNLEDTMNNVFPDRNSIDIGIDNAAKLLGEYRPFSMADLRKIFQ